MMKLPHTPARVWALIVVGCHRKMVVFHLDRGPSRAVCRTFQWNRCAVLCGEFVEVD